jgi:uncharacterized protein (TIGR02453 family)
VTTGFAGFPPEAIQFLRGLKKNNRREWFQPRKDVYEQQVKAPMTELVSALNRELALFAPDYIADPKKAIFRIYRDTRFSADKTPYKTHTAAWFAPRGQGPGGAGLYFSVSADSIEIAGGVYHPERDVLLAVRTLIAEHHTELRRILKSPKVKKLLGDLQGGELTRVPKGFCAEHPAADLIKKKDWVLGQNLEPSLATSPELLPAIRDRFRAMGPFLEFMNRSMKPKKSSTDFLL